MPRRHWLQREKDLAALAERYCRGEPQWRIAQALGVSQPQICDDLKTLQGRWLVASVKSIDELKARELAKIDTLEAVYWERWEASKAAREVRQTTRTLEKSDPAEKVGKPVKGQVMIRTEAREGNPVFLAGIQWCIERRIRLLGLDAPKEIKVDLPMLYAEAEKAARAAGLDPEEVKREAELILRQAGMS